MNARKRDIAAPLGRGHRSPSAINQIDQGNFIIMGEVFDKSALPALATGRTECGAAADSEILTADGDRPSIYPGEARDIRSRGNLDQLVVFIIFARTGESAYFPKALNVYQLR